MAVPSITIWHRPRLLKRSKTQSADDSDNRVIVDLLDEFGLSWRLDVEHY